jgi:hypothetical protein
MFKSITTIIIVLLLAGAFILKRYEFTEESNIVLNLFWLVLIVPWLWESFLEKSKTETVFYLIPFTGFLIFLLLKLVEYFY